MVVVRLLTQQSEVSCDFFSIFLQYLRWRDIILKYIAPFLLSYRFVFHKHHSITSQMSLQRSGWKK